jgi:hypothetical protein
LKTQMIVKQGTQHFGLRRGEIRANFTICTASNLRVIKMAEFIANAVKVLVRKAK